MNDILERLYTTIKARRGYDPDDSYVASLFHKGTPKIAQKVGEEATETVIEAARGNYDGLKRESADLLFHLMVLWADQGLTLEEITEELERREGTSGHEEKKARDTR